MEPNKCTIVSLMPRRIYEVKPGLVPGVFEIAECIPGDPDEWFQTLMVGASTHKVYINADEGSYTAVATPQEVARSVVQDYNYSQPESNFQLDAHAGLFFVEGGYEKHEIAQNFQDLLDEAKGAQSRWFARLVRAADDDWQKYHLHRNISNLQREALAFLGLQREWSTVVEDAPQTCPACMLQVSHLAIICPNCKCVLDKIKYATLQFA